MPASEGQRRTHLQPSTVPRKLPIVGQTVLARPGRRTGLSGAGGPWQALAAVPGIRGASLQGAQLRQRSAAALGSLTTTNPSSRGRRATVLPSSESSGSRSACRNASSATTYASSACCFEATGYSRRPTGPRWGGLAPCRGRCGPCPFPSCVVGTQRAWQDVLLSTVRVSGVGFGALSAFSLTCRSRADPGASSGAHTGSPRPRDREARGGHTGWFGRARCRASITMRGVGPSVFAPALQLQGLTFRAQAGEL